jgi:glycosyltransferase involved in cell wall biosynthesis
MYCGNCFRDNALVAALRKMGHNAWLVPLYLPLTLEEADQSSGTPVFFSGINVYLEQKYAFFRRAPGWLRHLLASPSLLQRVGGAAAKMCPEDLGNLTLSMLRGEEGNQARELEQLIAWLRSQPKPDLVCLSNALLIGLARRIKLDLGIPVVCTLQGEHTLLDALPQAHRAAAWKTAAERASEADLLIAPSRYFAAVMSERLSLEAHRVRVVYPGINCAGYSPPTRPPSPPVLGYFARMCQAKGLDTLVEAYLLLRRRDRVKHLKLRVGGWCGPTDEPFLIRLRQRLKASGLSDEAEFCPNLDRAAKQAFLRTLSVFSVPALYGEAFGLYLPEAWATGLPVVQPRHGAFPELIEATGGGVLCEPGAPAALADAIERVLMNPAGARALGEAGRRAALEQFSVERSAEATVRLFEEVITGGHR